MENTEIIELFKLNDDKSNIEVPGGWRNYDYDKAYMNVLNLKQCIEKLVEDSCYMDSKHSVKGASYIVDIELPESSLVHNDEDAKIRISHFGSMLTIIGNKKHDSLSISEQFREDILDLIAERGFILIPNAYLWIKYPKEKKLMRRKFKNWGHRYFELI